MKTKILFILSSLLFFTACEKEVEFESPSVEAENNLVINAVAIEGVPLKVYLNRSYPIGKTPLTYIGTDAIFAKNNLITDYQTWDYYKKTAVPDAEVTVDVNGQQTYTLALDSANICYFSNYVPQVNDHIMVTAVYKELSWDDKVIGTKTVSAETTVPAKPRIEVTTYEVLDENPYRSINELTYTTDTIMRLTCRISDTGSEQYYRLRIRGVEKGLDGYTHYHEIGDYVHYLMQDVYFSEDELFVDNRLTKGFGGWPAFFSNVFDNTLFKGSQHTFTIDSPKPNAHWYNSYSKSDQEYYWLKYLHEASQVPDLPSQVMVELQAISPEFYHYLKSIELYRNTETDAFSEPVQIYSNVQNGWGIFGALSYDRHFVEYGE